VPRDALADQYSGSIHPLVSNMSVTAPVAAPSHSNHLPVHSLTLSTGEWQLDGSLRAPPGASTTLVRPCFMFTKDGWHTRTYREALIFLLPEPHSLDRNNLSPLK